MLTMGEEKEGMHNISKKKNRDRYNSGNIRSQEGMAPWGEPDKRETGRLKSGLNNFLLKQTRGEGRKQCDREYLDHDIQTRRPVTPKP